MYRPVVGRHLFHYRVFLCHPSWSRAYQTGFEHAGDPPTSATPSAEITAMGLLINRKACWETWPIAWLGNISIQKSNHLQVLLFSKSVTDEQLLGNRKHATWITARFQCDGEWYPSICSIDYHFCVINPSLINVIFLLINSFHHHGNPDAFWLFLPADRPVVICCLQVVFPHSSLTLWPLPTTTPASLQRLSSHHQWRINGKTQRMLLASSLFRALNCT